MQLDHPKKTFDTRCFLAEGEGYLALYFVNDTK